MARSYDNLLLVNNPIGVAEVYSQVNSYPNPETTVTNKPAMPEQVAQGNSSPLTVWFVVLGLFIAIVVWARYGGGGTFGENFKNIRPSAFNIIFVGLVVAVALPLFKIIGSIVPNKSVKDYLHAV